MAVLKTSLNVGGGSDRTDTGIDGDSSVAASSAASNTTRPAYEELFNSFAEAVYVLDEHGYFLDVNDAAMAMYGHPREYFTGKTYDTITPGGLNDPSAMARLFNRALAGRPQSLECWGMRADGEQFPQDLRLTPTTCAGRPALIAVARDVTRQKQAEMQVHRLNRLYAVLNATNEFIVRCHDAHTLFGEACRIAVEIGGFRMTWIGLADPIGEEIKPVAYSGEAGDYLEHLHIATTNDARGNGPTGEALRKGKFKVCNDIANDPRMAPWREHAARMGYRASAAFPLRVAGELRGALSLYSDTVGFFDTEEIGLLERLSQNISFALEVIDTESRRLAIEEMLRIKERALSTSINGIAMADLDGTLNYVNRAFLDLWGYQKEDEVLGRSVLEFWKSHEQASVLMEQLFVQGFIRGDLIGKRKDGSTFVTQLSANLVTDPHGEPVCMQGAFIDISERQAAEEMMQWDREQQATLRGMLEAVLTGGTLEETLDFCLKQLLAVSWLSILPKGMRDHAS